MILLVTCDVPELNVSASYLLLAAHYAAPTRSLSQSSSAFMADDSDSSSLSSAPEEEVKKLAPIFQKAKLARSYVPKSPPRKPQRPPSPPHEEVLADNADIAVSIRQLPGANGRARDALIVANLMLTIASSNSFL